ncbi:hypothetical protein M9H77_12369 [Catharanthus roseus]|uniref:Uncharacterized protein n=1 Tax=Catharanthus roseus TaxID=4058 RepID=A0ACC0BH66_CATRO|nr:hypothetical protein M9H77_12369 [Catharanthus roseus]
MRRSWLGVGHCLRDGYTCTFLCFAPTVRLGAKLCKPYIQQFAMLGHKSKHKLLDIRIRLDVKTADDVRWTSYRPEEIQDVWTWTSVTAVPPSRCIDDYMPWFVPRTHPRTQNPERLPRGVRMLTTTPLSEVVLLDMIDSEMGRDDTDSDTKIERISEMIKKYYQPRP